jgi:hypothetical protein
MTHNHSKGSDGKYHINGKSYEMLIGTRAQVWHGTAYKTSGGLVKSDIIKNHAGRIVSKSKHMSAKREMRLVKAGYGTKKGKFGYVKLNSKSKKSKKSRKSRKMRGGSVMKPLSPSNISGEIDNGQYGSSSWSGDQN